MDKQVIERQYPEYHEFSREQSRIKQIRFGDDEYNLLIEFHGYREGLASMVYLYQVDTAVWNRLVAAVDGNTVSQVFANEIKNIVPYKRVY